jgi:FixJ family two-component response regulator
MAVEAMKAGAVDFLQKPYREQTLLDRIHAALSAMPAPDVQTRPGIES